MDRRKAYSKQYNESKQLHREAMQDAIKRFAEQNPERFAELQAQALHELEHPPERPVIRYTLPSKAPYTTFDVDEFIRQHHTQSYYIHTSDVFGDTHLYFESLDGEIAMDVLNRRHPKFTERSEKVTKVEKCQCPLCQNLA